IDAFKMGLYTGLRREEIFSLRWSDIKKVNDGNLLLVVPNLKVERITKKVFRPKYVAVYQDLFKYLQTLGLDLKIGENEYIICPNRTACINTLSDCTSRAFKHYYSEAYPHAKEVLPFRSLRKTHLTYLSKYTETDTIY